MANPSPYSTLTRVLTVRYRFNKSTTCCKSRRTRGCSYEGCLVYVAIACIRYRRRCDRQSIRARWAAYFMPSVRN